MEQENVFADHFISISKFKTLTLYRLSISHQSLEEGQQTLTAIHDAISQHCLQEMSFQLSMSL